MAERTWKSYCKHADALLDMGRAEAALESAQRALGLDIQQSEAWFEACRALLALGRAEEALVHAESGLQRRPDSPWGHRLRSTALSMLERHAEALEEADEAIRLSPDEALGMRRRARCLYALDRDEEALEQAEAANAADPESHYGYALHATIALYLKRLGEAEAAARQGLALAPGNVELLCRLGDILRMQDQPLEAMLAYRDALRIDPTEARPKQGIRASGKELRAWRGCLLRMLLLYTMLGAMVVAALALEVSNALLLGLVVLTMLAGIGLESVLTERRFRTRLQRADPGLLELWRQVEAEARSATPRP